MRGPGCRDETQAMITVDGVSKTYGGYSAVDDVSFVARPGRVTGFLGPNGAGKSTTMRIMVGLTPASRGRVTIGGHRYGDLPNPGVLVGVLLDASAQHTGRTGREILTIGAETMGLPRARVEEMLDLVSLTQVEARRRLRDYSLGMRQRLGLAHALLGDPSVLILDEPANGLDPAGIHWMRGLLGDYAARGGTVLLSSHLLHEVEKIADDLVLIGRGRIVAQGTKRELLQTRGAYVKAVEHDALATALARAGIHTIPSGDGLRSDAEPAQIGKIAAAENLTLVELRPAEGAGLEDLFLQLTADTQREGDPT
jgi:ABC-2 type transport system ATP-binding protein